MKKFKTEFSFVMLFDFSNYIFLVSGMPAAYAADASQMGAFMLDGQQAPYHLRHHPSKRCSLIAPCPNHQLADFIPFL